MRLTFLGTGTSMGVPVIGCDCVVCMSSDPHNHRLRTSAWLQVAGLSVLFDAGPDLRQQALAAHIRYVDAVLLTHAHFDHTAGIDDLRPLNLAQGVSMPLYGSAETLGAVRERFSYAFAETSVGSTRPQLDLVPVAAEHVFHVGSVSVLPIDVQHGSWTITGYRIGGLGYITDASAIKPESLAHLHGLDVLVLNTLRREPHPTHFSVAESLAIIEYVQPRRALLVHTTHDLDYAATNATLPPHVQLAYDGQVVDIADTVNANESRATL